MTASPPIVYCETNWIVALAFPHHQLHRASRELREAAQRGECQVRVPAAALLEARGTLSDVSNQLASSFATLRNDVMRAVENGLAEFTELATALRSDVVDTYAQRKTLSLLQELENDPAIHVLDDVQSSISVLRELRHKVRVGPKDLVDLHLLAAIVHDRRAHPSGVALFFSHNKKEFDPKRGKVPEYLYRELRLAWSDDFDLPSRLKHWAMLHVSS